MITSSLGTYFASVSEQKLAFYWHQAFLESFSSKRIQK